jgi:SulP family sulfate permease
LTQRGIVLHLCGLKLPIEQVLRQAQAIEPGPHFELYRTEQQALDALGQ